MELCTGCTVLANDCRREIPPAYLEAFEQKPLDFSYIYSPYKFPEVLILEGLPAGGFAHICSIQQDSISSATCFEQAVFVETGIIFIVPILRA